MSSHASTQSAHRTDGRISSIRDEITDLKDSIQHGAKDAADHGRRVALAAGSAAQDAAVGLRDTALRTHQRARKTIAQRPYTSVAIAAGAGAALMALAMMWRRRP
jgi:ElaB/YqjD/DUF883 family membrane-anchored ribosome-binding protein